MELFKYEHRKLWRRKSVQIGVLLCFLYIVIFGGLLSYQWFTFGSQDDFTSSFGNILIFVKNRNMPNSGKVI